MEGADDDPPTEHRLVVDRLEGDLAVVEVDGGPALDLPLWLLPPGVSEGDVVKVATTVAAGGERRLSLRLDPDGTREAREAAASRLQRLLSRDPGGDVEL